MKKVDGREIINKSEEIVTQSLKENSILRTENKKIAKFEKKIIDVKQNIFLTDLER